MRTATELADAYEADPDTSPLRQSSLEVACRYDSNPKMAWLGPGIRVRYRPSYSISGQRRDGVVQAWPDPDSAFHGDDPPVWIRDSKTGRLDHVRASDIGVLSGQRAPIPTKRVGLSLGPPLEEDAQGARQPEPEVAAGQLTSWAEIDLDDILEAIDEGRVEELRTRPTIADRGDGKCLFYTGKVNGVAGESGAGKSWVGLQACAQQITAGEHVVYIDLEDDKTNMVLRLVDLGLTTEAIRERFHYHQPDDSFGLLAREELRARVEDWKATLVVIDSTGESLAMEGLKPNDDDDVARWFRKLPRTISSWGPAVVILDHVVKDSVQQGLWPIGSQRKRAAISGAQYMQTVMEDFSREASGRAKLVCAKDRHGNWKRGDAVAHLVVTVDGPSVNIELATPPFGQPGSQPEPPKGGTWEVTKAAEIVEVFKNDRAPKSKTTLYKILGGNKGNLFALIDKMVEGENAPIREAGGGGYELNT